MHSQNFASKGNREGSGVRSKFKANNFMFSFLYISSFHHSSLLLLMIHDDLEPGVLILGSKAHSVLDFLYCSADRALQESLQSSMVTLPACDTHPSLLFVDTAGGCTPLRACMHTRPPCDERRLAVLGRDHRPQRCQAKLENLST